MVTFTATRTAFWLGISTAEILSIDPPPCGLARCTKAKTATMAAITANTIPTTLAGGKLRLAVPNSSPISNGIGGSGAALGSRGAGEAGGGAGVSSAIGSSAIRFLAAFDCNATRQGWLNLSAKERNPVTRRLAMTYLSWIIRRRVVFGREDSGEFEHGFQIAPIACLSALEGGLYFFELLQLELFQLAL